MKAEPLAIPDVILLTPQQFADSRGVFVETWNSARYAALGIPGPFVQDNQSLSVKRGTVRGMHLQVAPNVQGKLVRCVRGAIWDVVVDVRPGSPTYGRHVGAELTPENGLMLYVPAGFAHGFVTREPDTEVTYKVSDTYAPDCDRGLAWDDPALGIAWGVAPDVAVLSDKDKRWPGLAGLGRVF